ncbi:MAG: hypothetical protein ACKO96_41040, partial [Flammeovirgaceae bacterium]
MDMSDVGKKRVQRAVKHSIATLNDILVDPSSSETIWFAPVVIEEPKILAHITPTSPIMVFGGKSLKA